MGSGELVELEVSTCGPDRRDLRLTYIGPTGTTTTDWAASLQHTHYSHIKKSRSGFRAVSEKHSIVLKASGASCVKLVDGRRYNIEFASDQQARITANMLGLPEIRNFESQNGNWIVEFENHFDRQTWNHAVSSITPAQTSGAKGYLHRLLEKQVSKEKETDQRESRGQINNEKKESQKLLEKQVSKEKETDQRESRGQINNEKKESQKHRSGFWCFW